MTSILLTNSIEGFIRCGSGSGRRCAGGSLPRAITICVRAAGVMGSITSKYCIIDIV